MMMMVMMASPVCVASTSKMKIDEFCHWLSALSRALPYHISHTKYYPTLYMSMKANDRNDCDNFCL